MVVDFKNKTLGRYGHILMLFYWPMYLTGFFLVEKLSLGRELIEIYSPLDDLIPFCEWFVIPYVMWYAAIFAISLYMLIYNVREFKRFMWYTIVTFTAATVFLFLFPNCQNLRPVAFSNDNILTRAVGVLYTIDTNTNVCPSVHVIGAIGVVMSSARVFSSRRMNMTVWFFTVLVCASTVFLKQHSVIDIAVGVVFSLFGYFICFWKK